MRRSWKVQFHLHDPGLIGEHSPDHIPLLSAETIVAEQCRFNCQYRRDQFKSTSWHPMHGHALICRGYRNGIRLFSQCQPDSPAFRNVVCLCCGAVRIHIVDIFRSSPASLSAIEIALAAPSAEGRLYDPHPMTYHNPDSSARAVRRAASSSVKPDSSNYNPAPPQHQATAVSTERSAGIRPDT